MIEGTIMKLDWLTKLQFQSKKDLNMRKIKFLNYVKLVPSPYKVYLKIKNCFHIIAFESRKCTNVEKTSHFFFFFHLNKQIKHNMDNVDKSRMKTSQDDNESDNDEPLIRAKLPAYLAEAFGDIYEEDGLLVLGRGLGLLHLIASFCRFYADTKEGHVAFVNESYTIDDDTASKKASSSDNMKKPPLVFVIGLRDTERKAIVDILELWGTPNDLLPTILTNESGQGKDRTCMYARGGIFLITSRILIVDLLTHVASPTMIDGMLVAHAENVTEGSNEAFILRIFKTQKAWKSMHDNRQPNLTNTTTINENPSSILNHNYNCGFVKAFSDASDSVMAGFHKVDKILKAMFVRKLYLYPRFHESVANELERNPPYVEELHLQLSPAMKEIQAAIAAAVTVSIRNISLLYHVSSYRIIIFSTHYIPLFQN